MQHTFNDGGRAEAGFKGSTGDCATRAVAIATGKSYREVYDLINEYAKRERRKKKSNARTGVYRATLHKLLTDLGWKWTACCKVGDPRRVHVCSDELPQGTIILRLSRHFTTVIDGVLHDTYDCSREGTRMVYGYWSN